MPRKRSAADRQVKIGDTIIEDTFAEAFPMRFARVVVSAHDSHWLHAAVNAVTGYGTSVIACDAETGAEAQVVRRPDAEAGADRCEQDVGVGLVPIAPPQLTTGQSRIHGGIRLFPLPDISTLSHRAVGTQATGLGNVRWALFKILRPNRTPLVRAAGNRCRRRVAAGRRAPDRRGR